MKIFQRNYRNELKWKYSNSGLIINIFSVGHRCNCFNTLKRKVVFEKITPSSSLFCLRSIFTHSARRSIPTTFISTSHFIYQQLFPEHSSGNIRTRVRVSISQYQQQLSVPTVTILVTIRTSQCQQYNNNNYQQL